ncbi:BTAD domain-containing putative transcriptional regulator [Actinoplanes sp. CA-030573]|uniref:AfsR/SARP family transcriptional regulator n=1 Tax=Actinoplanes sp. CA-030573 TaxID=3239898 RepID=UPI003D92646D
MTPSGGRMAVEFRVLGEVEAVVDGGSVDLGHARQRCVLAALLVDANRAVPPDRILDRVWGEDPPECARGVLRTYVSRLRRSLRDAAGDVAIERRPDGYVLTVEPEAVDVHRFGSLLARARAAEDDDRAVELFDRALGLWRGEPFGVADTPWLNGVRDGLLAQRQAAVLDRHDAALRAGQHGRLLPDLLTLARAHPLDERIAALLMLAQYRCGRQADALATYQGIRRTLAETLGADPGPVLQRAHRRVLSADPALEPASRPRGPASSRRPVPRQLPAAPARFTGRGAALTELGTAPDAAFVCAIGGAGGIGKTWLALRWAHDNASRFPDGQLYVNLRGFDPVDEPVPPATAVRGFLEALGVEAPAMPPDLDGRVALFRSLIADRRMLLVLDNARDAAQVVPLLPGAAPCAVLITSRRHLLGLVSAYGARPLTLDVLTEREARQLLADRVGVERVVTEPDAAAVLLRWCAGLPLALSIVAARAASHPQLPLAALAGELDEAATRLDALDGGEVTVSLRAVLSTSCRALTPGAARLFGLLGLCPGPDFTVPAAASLAALPAGRIGALLRELTDGHLVQMPAAGRYRMHDLVRLFAAERAADRATALRRILDHYTHTAVGADRLLAPHRDLIALGEPAAGVVPERFADHGAALAWFAAEHAGLQAAQRCAAEAGLDDQAGHLAWGLTTFLDRSGYWQDRLAVHAIALAASRRLADTWAQGHAHREMALCHVWLGRHDEARTHLRHALELFQAIGCVRGQADTQRGLARVHAQQGRHREALPHDRHALRLYQVAGHRPGEAVALNAIGWHHAHLGDPHQAVAYCTRSLALHRELGDRHGMANAWDSLGYAHHQLGRHAEARGYYRQAADMFAELGDRYRQGAAHAGLGDTLQAAGETGAARRAWQAALAIFQELRHPRAADLRTRLYRYGPRPVAPAA